MGVMTKLGAASMELVAEFRKNTQACRAMAEKAKTQELRSHFMELAKQWTSLAAEREKFIQKSRSAEKRRTN